MTDEEREGLERFIVAMGASDSPYRLQVIRTIGPLEWSYLQAQQDGLTDYDTRELAKLRIAWEERR